MRTTIAPAAVAAAALAAVLLAGCGAGGRPDGGPAAPPAAPEQSQADLRAEKVCAAARLFDPEYQAVMIADHGDADLSTPDGYTLSRDPYLDGGNAPPFTLDEVAAAVASQCPDQQDTVDTIENLLSLDPDRGPLRQEPAGPETIAFLVGNGEYSAGTAFAGQMMPGTWQLRTDGRPEIKDCFYSRGAAGSGEIIEKGLIVSDSAVSVTVLDGESFYSGGCGLWEWTR